MTSPRNEIFNPHEVAYYHCVSRCVRRAFLCGHDTVTGTSFEHRRAWIRDRLTLLSKGFCIEIASYAVMSNHLHTLIRNRPDLAAKLTPEEVATRWLTLFPRRRKNGRPAEPNEIEVSSITNDPELVKKYRERLSSISWFNGRLCEYIARRANKEDNCSGCFWEGRFKSQRVHDVAGLLACSVYIDLNPIRAGVSTTPEDSDYTSVQDRIRAIKRGSLGHQTPPLLSIEEATEGQISIKDYLSLVDSTGRTIIAGKGSIPEELDDILVRLKINPKTWLDTTTQFRRRFKRMVGPVEALLKAAEQAGKHWFQGMTAARNAFA